MARRGQLVTQYLENVSREVLDRYQDTVRSYVRNRHGVYVLYRRGRLYYVGLAGNLRNRLQQHLRDRHGHSWDRFSVYLTIHDMHMKELEALTLRIMRPPGNKHRGEFAKAENLRRRLRRDIRAEQWEELQLLIGDDRRKAKLVRVPPAKKEAEGRRPALAAFIERGFQIRARWKGTKYKARVLRDGRISLKGKRYRSPSLAASSIARHAMNGWLFWQFERSPGDWVELDHLRAK